MMGDSTRIDSPMNIINVFDSIYSHLDKVRSAISGSVFYSEKLFEILNPYINAPFGSKVKILSEHTSRKVGKNNYEIEISFYAVDQSASHEKNEIYLPQNSMVFQVSSDGIFSAFEDRDGNLFYIRTDEEKRPVNIVYIRDVAYTKSEDDVYEKAVIIDNSRSILKDDVVYTTKECSCSTTFISNDGLTKFSINNSEYENSREFILATKGIKGKNERFSAKFIDYGLANLSPALKGFVKALSIDGEIYMSDKRA